MNFPESPFMLAAVVNHFFRLLSDYILLGHLKELEGNENMKYRDKDIIKLNRKRILPLGHLYLCSVVPVKLNRYRYVHPSSLAGRTKLMKPRFFNLLLKGLYVNFTKFYQKLNLGIGIIDQES